MANDCVSRVFRLVNAHKRLPQSPIFRQQHKWNCARINKISQHYHHTKWIFCRGARISVTRAQYLQCQIESGIPCDGVFSRYASHINHAYTIFPYTSVGGINVNFIEFYDRCIRIQYRSNIIAGTHLRQTLTHLQHMTLKVQ